MSVFTSARLRAKLILHSGVLLILSITAIGLLSFIGAKKSLNVAAFDRLTAV